MAEAQATQGTNAPNGMRPKQVFENNIRPAQLMLQFYRLLDCADEIRTDGEFVDKLRGLVAASAAEELMVVQNEIFLGLVREGAHLPKASLKRATLNHLLRQAIVASCTALDTYLPALLTFHLPTVISAKGREFFPRDQETANQFKNLTFDLSEVVRAMEPDAHIFIANKMLRFLQFQYLSSKRGIHVVGALLSIEKPWEALAVHLGRDQKELTGIVDAMADRRNDIVHRADRSKKAPDGEQQAISYATAMQGVDTIAHVCLALNELVDGRMANLKIEMARKAEEERLAKEAAKRTEASRETEETLISSKAPRKATEKVD